MNKMNIRINRRKVYILLYIYGRLRCYAGAARRKPYVVPSSTKWPHFTHLTQMTSSECKQFLKIIFHAFQNFSTLTPDTRWLIFGVHAISKQTTA